MAKSIKMGVKKLTLLIMIGMYTPPILVMIGMYTVTFLGEHQLYMNIFLFVCLCECLSVPIVSEL